MTGYEVMRFLETADMEQMENFMLGAASRLQTLAKQNVGMKHANLYEARDFALDAAKDIRGAINAEDDRTQRDRLHFLENILEDDDLDCKCGKCDACVAVRSDEHYSRNQDGILTQGDK